MYNTCNQAHAPMHTRAHTSVLINGNKYYCTSFALKPISERIYSHLVRICNLFCDSSYTWNICRQPEQGQHSLASAHVPTYLLPALPLSQNFNNQCPPLSCSPLQKSRKLSTHSWLKHSWSYNWHKIVVVELHNLGLIVSGRGLCWVTLLIKIFDLFLCVFMVSVRELYYHTVYVKVMLWFKLSII
jgi:hypothetical protein